MGQFGGASTYTYAKTKLNEGKRLAREGNPGKATECFWIAAWEPKIAHLGHFYWGLQMMALGLLEEALERFDESLRRDPLYAEALHKKCVVLYLLGMYGKADECFEMANRLKADRKSKHLHEMRRAGLESQIRPDFMSESRSRVVPDSSIWVEVMGIGSQRHAPRLLQFLRECIGRLAVTKTIRSEVRGVAEDRGRRDDPVVREVLWMMEAAVLLDAEDGEVDAVLAELNRMHRGAIAGEGRAGRAGSLAKIRGGKTDEKGDGASDKDGRGRGRYKKTANDRMIIAEAAAGADAARPGKVYLVTSDSDMFLFAADVYAITGGAVLPVLPEQIMWGVQGGVRRPGAAPGQGRRAGRPGRPAAGAETFQAGPSRTGAERDRGGSRHKKT